MKQNTKSLFNLWSEVVFASALTFRQAWNYYQQQTTLETTNIFGQVAKYYWWVNAWTFICIIRLLCNYLKALQQSCFSKILNQSGYLGYFSTYKCNLAPRSMCRPANDEFRVGKLSMWLLGPECWTLFCFNGLLAALNYKLFTAWNKLGDNDEIFSIFGVAYLNTHEYK